ncbi:MAG: mycofactocin-coupled SDR family oxidoreductase [Actinobacteria bacterium]|nr:mycofactocin-coupled SDR family oxidoreductase [Actinomycetota bacterium]
MKELEGKTALITGAARGQGRTHAVALAREGANVVVTDLHQEQLGPVPYPLAVADDLAETVRAVEAEGVKALSLTVDVRDADAVDGAAAAAVAEFGSLDVVCANAGIWAAAEIAEMTEEQWQTVIDINLTGVFHTVRAAAREMKKQNSGRIICTASTAGRAGMANFGNYVAAKWGVIGLVKSAALELAPHHINVNAICPACVKTDMMFENQALYHVFRPDLESPTTADIEATIEEALHKLPEPWIEPEEVSAIVVFLAGERGKHISGTGFDITMGASATWTA